MAKRCSSCGSMPKAYNMRGTVRVKPGVQMRCTNAHCGCAGPRRATEAEAEAKWNIIHGMREEDTNGGK